ncbi:MAG: ABC transporter substrate-binding protein, partial [SAR202 cluster bacterium]|nr:ABC transporter substrate-binding protein [SAR202 cluster bacterium]
SPLFDEKFANRWSQFDLNGANQMLDNLGLVKRNSKGFRLLPNGQPMELTVVFSTEEDEPSDILELVSDTWRKIGIKVLSKPLHREVMRNRIFSGNVQMSIWSGLENGIPNASSSPAELAPTSQQQLQWPMWGQYLETGGKSGQAIDMEVPQKLFELKDAWREARSEGDRIKIWHEMLDTYTSNVFSIGIIASVPQVVLVNSRLQNVPDKAIYNWDPGAHFGIYRPCTFWFDSVN